MKRIATILLLLLSITTNAQLHGKLGTTLQKECKKGNIIKLQATALETEIQEYYKELIRDLINKELSKKCKDTEGLELILDSLDSKEIIIWQPQTTKGDKILRKRMKKLAISNKADVIKELSLWSSKIFRVQTKSARAQKYLGIWDKDNSATITISSSEINDTISKLQAAAIKQEEGKETLYILYYINGNLIYWSNK